MKTTCIVTIYGFQTEVNVMNFNDTCVNLRRTDTHPLQITKTPD